MERSTPVWPISGNWREELTRAIKAHPSELRVIAPFIKKRALKHLLSLKPEKVRVITRFNLDDCADGASDIGALKVMLKAGAQVRGIKDLHSKVYLFGESQAIVTSANLTKSALESNLEFGLATEDIAIVKTCGDYFEELWRLGVPDLTACRLRELTEIFYRHHKDKAPPARRTPLGDFGADVRLVGHPSTAFTAPTPKSITKASTPSSATEKETPGERQAYVKLFGTGKHKRPLSSHILDLIVHEGCHLFLSYPENRPPKQSSGGEMMFIAYQTDDHNDIRVFGRAVAGKRDQATAAEKKRRHYKKAWSQYIRVHDAEFVDGTLGDGVSLFEMFDALEEKSFESTQQNANNGEGNTDPRRAYWRQAHVRLTIKSRDWLAERLQEALSNHGAVPKSVLENID